MNFILQAAKVFAAMSTTIHPKWKTISNGLSTLLRDKVKDKPGVMSVVDSFSKLLSRYDIVLDGNVPNLIDAGVERFYLIPLTETFSWANSYDLKLYLFEEDDGIKIDAVWYKNNKKLEPVELPRQEISSFTKKLLETYTPTRAVMTHDDED